MDLPKRLPPKPFEKGNTLWDLRIRKGQERMFTDPQALLIEFEKYVNWANDNPIIVSEKSTSQGFAGLTEVPYRRPITIGAFCIVIGCNEDYLRNFRNDVKKKIAPEAFGPVIDEIYLYVDEQLFEGATVNQFNANIISRKLGLIDRSDVTTKGDSVSAPAINIYNTAPPFALGENEVDQKKKEGEKQ